jgi:hypothetical protein
LCNDLTTRIGHDFTQLNLDNTMMGPHSINTLDSISSPAYTISSSGTVGGSTIAPGSVLTANGSWTPTPTLTVNQGGTIQLDGTNADILINGESLMETLRGIQDRLNMLRPNTELEAEWDELRELGEQYRKLEAEFKEKSKMWNTLKK